MGCLCSTPERKKKPNKNKSLSQASSPRSRKSEVEVLGYITPLISTPLKSSRLKISRESINGVLAAIHEQHSDSAHDSPLEGGRCAESECSSPGAVECSSSSPHSSPVPVDEDDHEHQHHAAVEHGRVLRFESGELEQSSPAAGAAHLSTNAASSLFAEQNLDFADGRGSSSAPDVERRNLQTEDADDPRPATAWPSEGARLPVFFSVLPPAVSRSPDLHSFEFGANKSCRGGSEHGPPPRTGHFVAAQEHVVPSFGRLLSHEIMDHAAAESPCSVRCSDGAISLLGIVSPTDGSSPCSPAGPGRTRRDREVERSRFPSPPPEPEDLRPDHPDDFLITFGPSRPNDFRLRAAQTVEDEDSRSTSRSPPEPDNMVDGDLMISFGPNDPRFRLDLGVEEIEKRKTDSNGPGDHVDGDHLMISVGPNDPRFRGGLQQGLQHSSTSSTKGDPPDVDEDDLMISSFGGGRGPPKDKNPRFDGQVVEDHTGSSPPDHTEDMLCSSFFPGAIRSTTACSALEEMEVQGGDDPRNHVLQKHTSTTAHEEEPHEEDHVYDTEEEENSPERGYEVVELGAKVPSGGRVSSSYTPTTGVSSYTPTTGVSSYTPSAAESVCRSADVSSICSSRSSGAANPNDADTVVGVSILMLCAGPPRSYRGWHEDIPYGRTI